MMMKSLRHFSRAALPGMPWKNGGGRTQEIACGPPGATLADFGWRVSIARIAADGPFSVFSNVDRVIMLLEGDGVRLRSSDGAIDHRLDAPHRPFAFAGDAAVDCALLGGASSDFNVMTRRGRWRAELQLLERASQIAAAPNGVLLALRGSWALGAGAPGCREGEGVCWTGEPMAWQAVPEAADARLAVLRIEPVLPAEDGEGRP
jgi:hypothetical protein